MEKSNLQIAKEQIQKTNIIIAVCMLFIVLFLTMCGTKSTNRTISENNLETMRKTDSLVKIINENQILIDHKIEKLNLAFLNMIEYQSNTKQKEELMKLLNAKDAQIKILKTK